MGTIGNGDTVTKTKEMGEGHDWTPRPRGQPHREETAVKKPWRRERSKHHCTHGNEGHGELLQSSTLDGSGAVRKYRERSRGRADNSQTAAPLPPKAPDPCPSRPANGGTDNRQKRAGRRRVQILNTLT